MYHLKRYSSLFNWHLVRRPLNTIICHTQSSALFYSLILLSSSNLHLVEKYFFTWILHRYSFISSFRVLQLHIINVS